VKAVIQLLAEHKPRISSAVLLWSVLWVSTGVMVADCIWLVPFLLVLELVVLVRSTYCKWSAGGDSGMNSPSFWFFNVRAVCVGRATGSLGSSLSLCSDHGLARGRGSRRGDCNSTHQHHKGIDSSSVKILVLSRVGEVIRSRRRRVLSVSCSSFISVLLLVPFRISKSVYTMRRVCSLLHRLPPPSQFEVPKLTHTVTHITRYNILSTIHASDLSLPP